MHYFFYISDAFLKGFQMAMHESGAPKHHQPVHHDLPWYIGGSIILLLTFSGLTLLLVGWLIGKHTSS